MVTITARLPMDLQVGTGYGMGSFLRPVLGRVERLGLELRLQEISSSYLLQELLSEAPLQMQNDRVLQT